MKKIWQLFFLIGGLFLIPILITSILQKDAKILVNRVGQEEKYLPGLLYQVAKPEMHMETLKAQAVLIRSNLRKEMEQGAFFDSDIERNNGLSNLRTEADKEFYSRIERACKETKGEVVTYDSKICYCPYFEMSNGTTRDAFSFFKEGRYPYLVAVPSHKDEESSTYITYHYFSLEEFREIMMKLSNGTFQQEIQILETDASGYITFIKVGDVSVAGEIFRKALNLSSSCFSIETESRGIRIACKGKGHGFGFSQYGANAMAKEQADYKELIHYYFHNISIENVYTFS